MGKLLAGYRKASEELGIPERTLRTLTKARVVPFIKTGHRTVFFDLEKIAKALQRRTVRENGA